MINGYPDGFTKILDFNFCASNNLLAIKVGQAYWKNKAQCQEILGQNRLGIFRKNQTWMSQEHKLIIIQAGPTACIFRDIIVSPSI